MTGIRALILEWLFAEATRIAMEAKDASLEYESACGTAQYIYSKEWGYVGSVMYAPIRR